MINKKKVQLFEEFSAGEITRPEQNVSPATKTTATDIAVDKVSNGEEIRAEIIKDVDAILTNLETLSTRIQENLTTLKADIEAGEAPEDILEALMTINEEGAGKKVMDLVWYAPKAKAAMKKVNKIKANADAIQFAADNMDNRKENEKKKKSLDAKARAAKTKADDLEKTIEDKFSDRGEVVKRAMKKTKIEGKLASIKKLTGMSDDPKDKKELKDDMAELSTKLKDEEVAMKELTKDVDAAEAKKAKKEAEEKAKKEAEEKAKRDKEEVEAASKEREKEREAEAEREREDSTAADARAELDKGKSKEVLGIEAKIREYESAVNDLSDNKDKKSKEKIGVLQQAIASKKEELKKQQEKEKKAKETQESVVYEGMSIADRFRNLI